MTYCTTCAKRNVICSRNSYQGTTGWLFYNMGRLIASCPSSQIPQTQQIWLSHGIHCWLVSVTVVYYVNRKAEVESGVYFTSHSHESDISQTPRGELLLNKLISLAKVSVTVTSRPSNSCTITISQECLSIHPSILISTFPVAKMPETIPSVIGGHTGQVTSLSQGLHKYRTCKLPTERHLTDLDSKSFWLWGCEFHQLHLKDELIRIWVWSDFFIGGRESMNA